MYTPDQIDQIVLKLENLIPTLRQSQSYGEDIAEIKITLNHVVTKLDEMKLDYEARLRTLEQKPVIPIPCTYHEAHETRLDKIETRLEKGGEKITALETQLKSHLDSSDVKEKISDKKEDRTQEYILFIAGMIGTLVVGYILAKLT